jgi:hypothetical protein
MTYQTTKKTITNSFLIILLIVTLYPIATYAQIDTIYTNSEKIACLVKEVTPDAVKFIYPGEEVLNSIYKNAVQKIIFKSGRIQTFAEATSFKVINNVLDYDKVTITTIADEVRGLYKLGDVSSKAKGTTVYSSQERVKERAYRKFKIQAAMLGANIIFLTEQRTEGNKYDKYNSQTSEANLTGIAYSNKLPNLENFKKLVGNKTDFLMVKEYLLWASDSDVSQNDDPKAFTLTNIINENGIIFIEGKLVGENQVSKFQLANFNSDNFSIQYKKGETDYNLVISF